MPAGGSSSLRPVPWFLATRPSLRSDMVARPGVTGLLDDNCARFRITAVAAPSGFGKTVAVTQWAAARQERDPGSVTWLTLTQGVSGPADLLRGILTALKNAAHARADGALQVALSSIFESRSYPEALAKTAALQVDPPVVVVVDDFQNARPALGGSGLVEFAEQGPGWLHLVVLTTEAAPSEWTRLRVHGQLGVIETTDLALSEDEVLAVAHLVGRPVTRAQAEQIIAETGGWPGAVRLILMGSRNELALPAGAELTDYIRSSVLGRMRPELSEFVLSTTVVNRLNNQLAVTLSGRPDGALLIGECVSTGLFIERFGSGEGTVYQWHSMFVDHCRTILRHSDIDRWRTLNRLAAEALTQRYPMEAAEHAIHAGDALLAREIIVSHWLEMLLQSRSEALDKTCVATIMAFGEHPELLMIRACCRDLAGDSLDAELLFARANALGPNSVVSARMSFIADLTKVLLSDDHDIMADAADRAQAALSERDMVPPAVYACALFVLGWASSRLRRGACGADLLEAAAHECHALGLTEVAERARQSLAFAAAAAGHFDRALAVLRRPHRPTDTPGLWLSHDGAGIERFTEGYVRFWRGELDAARDDFVAMDASVGAGYPDIGRMMLALTVSTLDDHAGSELAEAAVARIPDADSHGVPWTSYKIAGRARLAELRGARSEALELASRLVDRPHIPMMSAVGSGIARRLREPILAHQLATVAAGSDAQTYSRAYGHFMLALLDWDSGSGAAAHRRLEGSLEFAAPERVRFPFIDNCDSPARELLAAHSAATAYRAFLDECLVAAERAAARQSVVTGEHLTSREREVLAYLRTPMTSGEIATQLSVSVNTLKTHQRAIYRKLGASNRREAIRIAGH